MKTDAEILEAAADLVRSLDELDELPLEIQLALVGRNVVIPYKTQAEFWRFLLHVKRLARARFGADALDALLH